MKIKAIITIAMALALMGAVGCQKKDEHVKAEQQSISGLKVVLINTVSVDEYQEASGLVRAKNTSVIASRLMGTVTAVHVNEGDRVRRGQALLSIDDRDVRQSVIEAEQGAQEARSHLASATSQKQMAESTYDRYKKLYDGKALSAQEMDSVETGRAVAEAELARAQAGLKRSEAAMAQARVYAGFTRITSPTDGIVTSRSVDAGSMAVPGMPLITVEEGASYRIEADLDESLMKAVTIGSPVIVNIDSLGRTIEGRVAEIVGHVDPATRTFRVKVALEDKDVRGGMYGRVSFKVGTKQAVLIPRAALVTKGQLTGVYLVGAGELISYRMIKAGRAYADALEVISGLRAGDRIITDGAQRAVEGARAEGVGR